MAVITLEHCERAVSDIASHGDNDVLPFDIDTRFVSEFATELADLTFEIGRNLERRTRNDAKSTLDALGVFSERLLAPAGASGFRVVTKIHPFWNIYLNTIATAVAELHEPKRSPSTHSYRFASAGPSLFDRERSWRAFRQATLQDVEERTRGAVVVQTDVTGFYEHAYHHRIENYLDDLLPADANHAGQIVVLLKKLSAGRSFGLPVGGQCARVLAEVLMGAIDRSLSSADVRWHRYVDDFVLIADSQSDAYRCLGVLAYALSDLGLSLNRTKTSFLTKRHYKEYVKTQLGAAADDSRALKEIDLRFDPYSDSADDDYEDLKETVKRLDIENLLDMELDKTQPDSFVVTQISRALRLLDVEKAYAICATLLEGKNLHAFRANWATIMRGVAAIRGDEKYTNIYEKLDRLLDQVPNHSAHLMTVDTNVLHYLRAVRFVSTQARSTFVLSLYSSSNSKTVRRGCIDCWRLWKDRERFIALRNNWSSLSPEEQRMLWLAAPSFGDDGRHFQRQEKKSLRKLWTLGLDKASNDRFSDLYLRWVDRVT